MKTDPVCGQSIDPLRARAVAIVAGERYYFCSTEHRGAFTADPSRFIASLRPTVALAEPPPNPNPNPNPTPSLTPTLTLTPTETPASDSLDRDRTPLPILAEGSPPPPPARPNPPPPRPATANLVRFEIGGMTGPEDADRVKRAIARVPGVSDVEIDLVTEVATVAVAHEAFAPPALIEAVATAGYEAAPRVRPARQDLDAVAARSESLRRRAVAAFAAAAVLALAPLPSWLATVLAAATTALAGRPRRGLAELPLLVAALGLLAAAIGLDDGALAAGAPAFIGLALAGRALEDRARHAAGRELSALAALPETARRVGEGGASTEVETTALRAGELVRVTAPDVLPVDGVVRSGSATVDESDAAGAGAAALREAGDPVVAGTVLVTGTILVEVRRTGRDRVLARLRAAVVEQQGSGSPLQTVAARAATLAPLVAGAAALAALGAQLALGRGWAGAIAAAAAALAAISPLAASLAVAPALAVATGHAARRGILYRNAEAFERTRDVRCVVLDKNATLMQGRRQVAGHAAADGGDPGRLIALAAAAEQMSDAPLARALRAYAAAEGVHVPPAERSSFTPGKGVSATVAGTSVVVGSRRMFEDAGVDGDKLDGLGRRLRGRHSGIFVAIDGKLAGALAIDEPLRAGAGRFVEELGRLGVRVALVTGDGRAAAEALAREAGIDEVHADLSPDDKKRVVSGLRGDGGAVAVVGDGVDDAVVLAAADVGVALGRGGDLALAAAAVTVVRGDLDGVLAALAGARRGVAVMRRNLGLVVAHAGLVAAGLCLLPLGAGAPLAAAASTAVLLLAIVAGARGLAAAQMR